MNKFLVFALAGMMALTVTGCKEQATTAPEPKTAAPAPAAPSQAAQKGISGSVTETVNSGGYTYVQVDTGTEKVWAAAPEFNVQVGDSVVVPDGMAMENYHSKTLNRDFPLVYFVPSVMVAGAGQAIGGDAKMPAGHPAMTGNGAAPAPEVDLSGIAKVEGGKSVEEIFAEQADLSGKEVQIRGKVVKFSPQIMGKNWIHLQDGTGGEKTNDLTVTTAGTAKVGDTVLLKGVVSTNKDFGYGYKYDVIIEDAQVTVE
ncbi:MAG: hypothetical protein C0617_04685 [Desulfuromonas sp.]|uniref:hypothetical protein n=1 Tax=Desulfuromonas sp. TaxID=892 RepID=UPI000CC5821E|nr:hypothetical protein [Desulfuromonas sp.]PLX85370.1 MAG: hypothetical protein C0617_04685 [Desulfuromonas sp.]